MQDFLQKQALVKTDDSESFTVRSEIGSTETTIGRGNGGSHCGTYPPAPFANIKQDAVAEQALTTIAPSFNLRQRRVIGDLFEQDSGGQMYSDLRQFTLGELSLDNYLARLDGQIQI